MSNQTQTTNPSETSAQQFMQNLMQTVMQQMIQQQTNYRDSALRFEGAIQALQSLEQQGFGVYNISEVNQLLQMFDGGASGSAG